MIRRLSPIVINQIAAGEVVERPASIVKELVENSLDAGAHRIDITLERGGRDMVRVSDDGCGIDASELELAVAPHATSKIENEADLAAIASLGFRGEALASIASVSRFSITSRLPASDAGARLEVEGGNGGLPQPIAAPPGTTVEIKRLFFNTPARRKFLKSPAAETSRAREIVQRLAAAHWQVSFTFRSGERTLLELPAANKPEDRIAAILGTELSGELISIEGEQKGVRLWGVIGTPQVARPTSRHLHVFVNGRAISDGSLTHAVREAFRGLIEPKRYPTAALFIEMDPSLVDANVHPRKSEVRFRDRDAMWHLVNRTIAAALAGRDIVPMYSPGPPKEQSFGSGMRSGFDVSAARAAVAGIPLPAHDRSVPPPLPTIIGPDAVMQVQKCFLVTQDEQGLLIIDQHALHERIMFEELKERLASGPLESQRLLVPLSMPADAAQLDAAEQYAALLAKLGIDATASGPASISLHAVPTLFSSRGVDAPAFVADLLEQLGEGTLPPDPEAALSEVLDMMACKAAIKAGDSLTGEETAALITKAREIDRSERCPHGRPTTMRLSIDELERRFGRK